MFDLISMATHDKSAVITAAPNAIGKCMQIAAILLFQFRVIICCKIFYIFNLVKWWLLSPPTLWNKLAFASSWMKLKASRRSWMWFDDKSTAASRWTLREVNRVALDIESHKNTRQIVFNIHNIQCQWQSWAITEKYAALRRFEVSIKLNRPSPAQEISRKKKLFKRLKDFFPSHLIQKNAEQVRMLKKRGQSNADDEIQQQ